MVCLIALTLLISACSERSPTETEEIIARSHDLTDLNNLCLGLARPQDFRLTGKSIGGNLYVAYLAFDFQSDMNFGEVKDFYQRELGSGGWKLEAVWEEDRTRRGFMQFQKEDYFVSVEHVSFNEAKFAVGCGRNR